MSATVFSRSAEIHVRRSPPNSLSLGRERRPVRGRRRNGGITLLEIVAVGAIVAVVAALVVTRFLSAGGTANENACYVHKAEVESLAQLWFQQKGVWPQTNLGDIGADTSYFPDGLPVCPVDGTSYTLDATTGKVVGHNH